MAKLKYYSIICHINNNLVFFYLRLVKNNKIIFQLYYKQKSKTFSINVNN